ncbi:hypothetical protein CGCFRS4_v016090 [Colletotrichum fructicola]|nr:hypothetical protein CGCFRS4_v016090 [Colletotrichum fructicola]
MTLCSQFDVESRDKGDRASLERERDAWFDTLESYRLRFQSERERIRVACNRAEQSVWVNLANQAWCISQEALPVDVIDILCSYQAEIRQRRLKDLQLDRDQSLDAVDKQEREVLLYHHQRFPLSTTTGPLMDAEITGDTPINIQRGPLIGRTCDFRARTFAGDDAPHEALASKRIVYPWSRALALRESASVPMALTTAHQSPLPKKLPSLPQTPSQGAVSDSGQSRQYTNIMTRMMPSPQMQQPRLFAGGRHHVDSLEGESTFQPRVRKRKRVQRS